MLMLMLGWMQRNKIEAQNERVVAVRKRYTVAKQVGDSSKMFTVVSMHATQILAACSGFPQVGVHRPCTPLARQWLFASITNEGLPGSWLFLPQALEAVEAELAREEAAKELLCSELNTLVQQSANAQLVGPGHVEHQGWGASGCEASGATLHNW
jgi:hypothetical protein